MREVFADTAYWIAIFSPKDNLHQRAHAAPQTFGPFKIVTSDMVLAEVLTAFCKSSLHIRKAVVTTVAEINQTIEVIPQTRRLFKQAFELHAFRLDKTWSLT